MNVDNAGVDGSFLGLGYSHHAGGGVEPSTEATASSAVDAADSLMKHYLQQCLDYHEEQQHQHEQKEATVPQFVAAQNPVPPQEMHATTEPQHAQAPIPSAVSADAALKQPSAQEAIAKARLIVQKWQPQNSVPREPSQQTHVTTSMTEHQHPPVPPSIEIASTPAAQEAIARARMIVQKFQQQQSTDIADNVSPAEYKYRREQHMERERQRLHKATLKNLEYMARREQERLQQQLVQLEETRQLEQQLHQQHKAVLLQKRQQVFTKAGIGTSQRQSLERRKQPQPEHSAAIYLSGLDKTMTEEAVKQLFSSYGSIRRVHLYRNKQTGQLKGDALVVYNVKGEEETQKVLNAACSQLNGAELPCGSVLHVEPADPLHKQKQGSQEETSIVEENGSTEDVGYYGPSSSRQKVPEPVASHDNGQKEEEEKEDDDLDDFFDSLT